MKASRTYRYNIKKKYFKPYLSEIALQTPPPGVSLEDWATMIDKWRNPKTIVSPYLLMYFI